MILLLVIKRVEIKRVGSDQIGVNAPLSCVVEAESCKLPCFAWLFSKSLTPISFDMRCWEIDISRRSREGDIE